MVHAYMGWLYWCSLWNYNVGDGWLLSCKVDVTKEVVRGLHGCSTGRFSSTVEYRDCVGGCIKSMIKEPYLL